MSAASSAGYASKEEIFREMLLRVSRQLEHGFPSGIETQGDVEDVLRVIAGVIVDLHKNPEYLGFLRMVVADSRQFPWIAKEFAAVMDPQTERLTRYLAHLTDMGILNCQNATLAAHQFMGIINDVSSKCSKADADLLPLLDKYPSVTTVILSNRKYQILLGELANVGANPGRTALEMMDLGNPDLNWARMAEGMGVEAARADTADRFADLFASSLARPGPFLIELVV